VTICTLTYTADTVRRADRTFFWRKFTTPLGLLYVLGGLGSLTCIWLVYSKAGPTWVVGLLGFVAFTNLLFQLMFYLRAPRAFGLLLDNTANPAAEVETSPEGIHVSFGRNAWMRPWPTFKYIWFYDDFVILVSSPPIMPNCWVLPSRGMSSQMLLELKSAVTHLMDRAVGG
jgi:hypothetical protein